MNQDSGTVTEIVEDETGCLAEEWGNTETFFLK